MHTLEFIAKLAELSKQDTKSDYAVLVDSHDVPLAVGLHPTTDTRSTAHSAIVNILQNHNRVRATDKFIVTYKPTAMCLGMLNNFKSSGGEEVVRLEVFNTSDEELKEGAQLDTKGVDVSSLQKLLASAKKRGGDVHTVASGFDALAKAPYTQRRPIPKPHAIALARVPPPPPFRGAAAPEPFADNSFMLLAFSLVALSWYDKGTYEKKVAPTLSGNNVGAVIVKNQQIISWGINVGGQHSTLHAETLAIQAYLERTGEAALPSGCVIYSTLQPCHMCAGFIAQMGHGVRVVYGMQDNQLQTCLKAVERPWLSSESTALIEAVNKKKGGQQGASTKFLRDGDIKDAFMPAFDTLSQRKSEKKSEQALLMHCRELLLIVAEQGLATNDGFQRLLAMADTLGAQFDEMNVGRASERVQEQRDRAHELAQQAQGGLEKAGQLHAEAERQLAAIQRQRDIATQAARGATTARQEASALDKVSEARSRAEQARKLATQAEDALDKAREVRGELKTGAEEGHRLAQDARNCANLAKNAAQSALARAEVRTVVGFLEKPGVPTPNESLSHKVKHAATRAELANDSAQSASVLSTKLSELLSTAARALLETETQCKSAAAEAERANLLVDNKRLVAEFDPYTSESIKTLRQNALEGAEEAKKQAQAAQVVLEEAEKAVSEFTSARAIQEANKSLALAKENVRLARESHEEAHLGAQSVLKLSGELEELLGRLKKASAQETVAQLHKETQAKRDELKDAIKGVKTSHTKTVLALNKAKSNRDAATTPITCAGKNCTQTLKQKTSLMSQWHACKRCRNHYCGACGSKLEWQSTFSRTRRCGGSKCDGTTELV
ncbi:Bd3614 family nucleic acid deaminase [Melittangium boletus]|uniref:Bd3614 family nucleic acid deaminase n=1 Tax=Melittangium boletus TaxID=83453 RepID=UPI003DA3B9D6